MYELQSWLNYLGLWNVNLNLIKIAFTHRSYKGMGYDVEDNERLEFLGDSVLDLVNADILFDDERLSEAEMTDLRKTYVSDAQLSVIFDMLDMKQFILTANKFKLTTAVKAGVVEAFFGAIFIENGYEKCYNLWVDIINKISEGKLVKKKTPNFSFYQDWFQDYRKNILKNAKSTLQEFCQSHQFENPEYIVIDKSGPEHDPIFTVKVTVKPGNNSLSYESIFNMYINNGSYASTIGKGKRKKDAEMDAAEKMCVNIGMEYTKD